MAYKRNTYKDQSVYINGAEIKGVQSFDGSWSIPSTKMNAAGYGYVGHTIEGVLAGDVSISRQVISSTDPIPNLLGTSINGYLRYGPDQSKNLAFNFNNGYINSFSSACSIGEVATADFSITAFGGIGKISAPTSAAYSNITPTTALAQSIVLTTPFGSTNAIQSYSFDVPLNIKPLYKMGDMFSPSSFNIETPIISKLNFEIFANEYEVKNVLNSVCSNDFIDNLSIQLKTCNGGNIRSFSFSNAKLVESSISSNIGNNLSINIGYEVGYSDINQVKSNLFS